jgi:hypothetical protein
MLDLTNLDDAHLVALGKALHEARFCDVENDPVVWGSPLVVDLHVWTLDEQQRRDVKANTESRWEDWLEWKGRPEVKTVVRRLRSNRKLLDVVSDDPSVLRDLLRPFTVDDESLDEIISAGRSTE